MIRSDSNWLAFQAWPLGRHKAMSISAHYDDLWSFAQIAISILNWRKRLTSDRTHGQRTYVYKKRRVPDWHSLSSILYFLHTQRHIQKARSFWLTSLIIYLMLFYTCSDAYKKLRCSRLTFLIIYLMLFICTTLCTKRKGLPIDVPYHLILFIHAEL
jgi:hypothetical protein